MEFPRLNKNKGNGGNGGNGGRHPQESPEDGGNGRRYRDSALDGEYERRYADGSAHPGQRPGPQQQGGNQGESSLLVGAKTLAGVGIGLVTVVVASTAVGLVVETVVIPSLLLKLAGGIAGGGLGMAKGLSDERKTR